MDVITVSGTSAFLNKGNLKVDKIFVLNSGSDGMPISIGSAISFGSINTWGGVAVGPSPVSVSTWLAIGEISPMELVPKPSECTIRTVPVSGMFTKNVVCWFAGLFRRDKSAVAWVRNV